ncbi:protein phosphatase 2C-like protein [Murinocardiopsis flavida]|uniref:Protein phosphatase 2C-like protein n=1 Tax=Murinocardiopsis flavida TaxID=645275 RepID=A0A2P8DG45_9ACTN|nr:protein phosphatase 2C domain-containing protein [Murinocardiopsis flavida]PSK96184.1 protein phosphatase 2C-like protein [Murinocardiopsis flavida]
MPFTLATEPGDPECPNEDFAAAGADCAVLLDGATAQPWEQDGCVHGVAWVTRRLGGALLAHITPQVALRDALAAAITDTARLHAEACDLSRQQSPSATVVAIRLTATELDYLVLADSVLAVEAHTGPARIITDTRLDDLRARLEHRPPPNDSGGCVEQDRARHKALRDHRNTTGGFWTAGADPRAAEEALTGAIPLSEIAAATLLTDGATRLVEVFKQTTWQATLETLHAHGPRTVIEQVRDAEKQDPDQQAYPRGKACDDATILRWTPDK